MLIMVIRFAPNKKITTS